jgi:hypothetical protein
MVMGHATLSRELSGLREAVARWREEGGGRGSKIPEDLWDRAVRVARVEGLWRTARTLGFEYKRLKERVEGAKLATKAKTEAVAPADGSKWGKPKRAGIAPSHRALRVKAKPMPPGGGMTPKSASPFIALEMLPTGGVRTVIELSGRRGDRMRVEIPGTDLDLSGLMAGFWRHKR